MKPEGSRPEPAIEPRRSGNSGPEGTSQHYLSTRGLVIVFAAIAAALVLGYLLLNKLVDMSQEGDCALAHRHSCGAVEVPRQ